LLFFSSSRRHTRFSRDWSSDVCSSDLLGLGELKSYALSQKPEHQQELKVAIKQKIAERSLAEWQEVFAEVDACVEPVLTIEEARSEERRVGEGGRVWGRAEYRLLDRRE